MRRLRVTAPVERVPIETHCFVTVSVAVSLLYAIVDPQTVGAAQIVVLSVLVALLGLPHGALDPLLARRSRLYHGRRSLLLFLIGYSTLSALIVGLWLLIPVASLIAFLMISAAHFGSDWNAGRPAAIRILAGVALLSLPAFRNVDHVAQLYMILSGPGARVVATWQSAAGPFLLVGLLAVAVIASRRRLHEGVELVVAAALALTTPPLVFFTVYFCLLHSARHLREGFAMEREALRRPAGRVLVGGATLVPMLVAVVLLMGDAGAVLEDRLLQIVFIGLAALTVPHILVVTMSARAGRIARAS